MYYLISKNRIINKSNKIKNLKEFVKNSQTLLHNKNELIVFEEISQDIFMKKNIKF